MEDASELLILIFICALLVISASQCNAEAHSEKESIEDRLTKIEEKLNK